MSTPRFTRRDRSQSLCLESSLEPPSMGSGKVSSETGDRLKLPGGPPSAFQKSPRKEAKRGGGGLTSAALRKISTASGGSDARKKSSSTTAQAGTSILIPAGATLKDLAASESDPVPVFVRKCVDFIESEGGLCLEGLYRVPGNQAQVSQLEQKFVELGAELRIEDLDLPISAVATGLKKFFDALPEPLIASGIFDNVVKALSTGRDESAKTQQLKKVLARLPAENRAVLIFFTGHLRKVANHAHVNSMDLRNLAKCLWPTLLRPHFESFEMMAQLTPRLEEFAHLLFSNGEFILGGSSLQGPASPPGTDPGASA